MQLPGCLSAVMKGFVKYLPICHQMGSLKTVADSAGLKIGFLLYF